MVEVVQKRDKKQASTWALIFLCWLVYTCSYVGKLNYTANITQVETYYSVNHAEAGLVSTCFFFAYGLGQVVNGIFCKKYNVKWMVFFALLVSSVVNLSVSFLKAFVWIKYLWVLNGLALSVLWPSLIRLLSETLSRKDMAKASIVMGTTIAVGTLLIYGLSAWFAVFQGFRLAFVVAAGVSALVALVWILIVDKRVADVEAERVEEEPQQVAREKFCAEKSRSPLLLTIVVLALYGVATNLVKDGLMTWVPSILKESFRLDDSLSIVFTLVMPMVAVFGNAFAVGIHKKLPDFVLQCALTFVCVGLILCGVLGGFSWGILVVSLIGFAVAFFLISSCNSLIVGVFPLFMKGKANSGLLAGVLDGCCYLGSAISSYGLGVIADGYGWKLVFWVLLGVLAFACVVAGIYAVVKKLIRRNHQGE
ncbi:MAG: MFS transporter [Clostridia bacterium]|nr:MFS transporter [Clostridia bacterium]